jgi:uncharacterized membrane protein
MAAAAYLVLPVTGLIAYFAGGSRTRLHGFQAVVLGLVWPLLLYLCSLAGPGATQVAFVVGVAVWLFFMIGTAIGRDPKIPVVWSWISRREDPQ